MKKEWHLTLSTNSGKIIRQLKGFEAYDNWHFLVRTKEVINIQNFCQNINVINSGLDKYFNQIPRKDKFLFLFLSILVTKSKNIFELGSSSCEFIDGINLFKKLTKKKINLNYFGIDHSMLMNQVAKLLHHKENLKIYKSISEIKNKSLRNSFLHDYGVSNYIFKDTKTFAKFMNKFDHGYSQMLFSKKKTMIIKQPSGKEIIFFSLEDFKKEFKYDLYYLFPTKSVKKWSALNNINNNNIISGYFFFSKDKKKILKLENYINDKIVLKNYCKKLNFKIKKI